MLQTLDSLLADRLAMLLVAYGLAALLIGPVGLYRRLGLDWTRQALVTFYRRAADKLNRQKRSVATRVYRGLLLVVFSIVMATCLGWLIERGAAFHLLLGWLEIFLIAWLIPVRLIFSQAQAVARQVKAGNLPRAKERALPIAKREVGALDAHGLLRVAIEYLAEQFCDKVCSPVLWYLLLGLPGLMVQRLCHLLDELYGYASPQWMAFGWAAAKCDDVMQWIPARLGAFLLILSGFFVPKSNPLAALRHVWGAARQTRSPNAGWPLAAMAHLLHVTLGGVRRQKDSTIEDAWIGQGTARVSLQDYRRALVIYLVAVLLLLLICAGLLVIVGDGQFSLPADLAERAKSFIS